MKIEAVLVDHTGFIKAKFYGEDIDAVEANLKMLQLMRILKMKTENKYNSFECSYKLAGQAGVANAGCMCSLRTWLWIHKNVL